MKDLYGLREEHVNILKDLGYIDKNTIVYDDGKSIIDGARLYVICFDTSEERDKAYNAIFVK